MSPYSTSVAEVYGRFSTTDVRKAILTNWIAYRQDLRSIGIEHGFQWLAGSFVEDKPAPPKDLDLVVFVHRPVSHVTDQAFQTLLMSRPELFRRALVKQKYMLDVFIIDLGGTIDAAVLVSGYFLQLFSHQRDTFFWKGILRVEQEDSMDETLLLTALTSATIGNQP
jgi:hypothetical protein